MATSQAMRRREGAVRGVGLLVVVMALLALAACAGDEEPDADPEPPDPSEEPDEDAPDDAADEDEDEGADEAGDGESHLTLDEPDDADEPEGPPLPLTGEPAADEDALDEPVVATKVDNHPSARPPVSVQDADVVYVQLIEHGLTRLVALHHSEVPERVGPVRSGRRVEAELLPPFDPALAISGAQEHILGELRQAGLRLYLEGARGTWERDPERPAPHDLFVHAASVREDAREAGLSAPEVPWEHAEEAPEAARSVRGAELTYPGGSSTTSWSWDEQDERFQRSQNGSPHGAASGERLTADNVLVARVAPTGIEERPFEVQGSGELTLLRDGKAIEGRWEKPGPGAHHRWLDADGDPLPLAPGTTWVELVGTNGSVALDEE